MVLHQIAQQGKREKWKMMGSTLARNKSERNHNRTSKANQVGAKMSTDHNRGMQQKLSKNKA